MGSKLTHAIDTSGFTKGKIVEYKGFVLDLSGDPRLDRLLAEVRSDIAKNGWTIPENEKEITDRSTELMQSDRYYGPYSTESSRDQGEYLGAQYELDMTNKILSDPGRYLKDDITAEEREELLEELREAKPKLEKKVEQEKQEVFDNQSVDMTTPLRDVKTGDTVCGQQSLVTSYIMHNVGLPNDVCIGVGNDNSILGHAFIQSQSGDKNIIDSTTKEVCGTGYWYNRNGAEIGAGEIVLGSETPDHRGGSLVMNYGGGQAPSLLGSVFKNKHLKEQIEMNDPQNEHEMKVEVVWANRRKAEEKQDSKESGGLFGKFSRLDERERKFMSEVERALKLDGDFSKEDKAMLKDLKNQLKEAGTQSDVMINYEENLRPPLPSEQTQAQGNSK